MKHPILKIEELSDEYYQVSGLLLPDLSQLRFWLWDLEATGLDTDVERVTQIAGIALQAGELIEDSAFSQFTDPGPGIEIPKEVQDLTGITLDTLKGAPPFAEAWRMGVDAAENCDVWIGQSVFEFDVPLLESEFKRHGLPPDLPPVLDSVVLATALLGEPEGRWSTSALIDKFEVDTSGLRRHDALDDVKILGRILIPMLEQFRQKHGDRLVIAPENPVRIRRHPPVKKATAP